eukprot:scaffold8998_cov114-Skeletonema_dohrnii-CCMP3373.AAC.1
MLQVCGGMRAPSSLDRCLRHLSGKKNAEAQSKYLSAACNAMTHVNLWTREHPCALERSGRGEMG